MLDDNTDQKKTIRMEVLRACGVQIKNHLPCTTPNVHLIDTNFGILHGFCQVCSHSFADQKTNKRSE